MISFNCPACSQNYSVPDDKAGKRTTCARCGFKLTVPPATGQPGGVVESGPVCSVCSSSNLSYKTISGPGLVAEKRAEQLDAAAEFFDQSLREIWEEVRHRQMAIDERAKEVPSPEDAKWLPTRYVATRAREESEALKAWAAEQERVARKAFEEAREQVKKAYPTQPKTQLNLVYCANCGHILTTTPVGPTEPSTANSVLPRSQPPSEPKTVKKHTQLKAPRVRANYWPAGISFVLAALCFLLAWMGNNQADEKDLRAMRDADATNQLHLSIGHYFGSYQSPQMMEPRKADRTVVWVSGIAGVILLAAGFVCLAQAKSTVFTTRRESDSVRKDRFGTGDT